MHPSNEIRGTASSALAGKRIVLGVTGSIAAVECVRLARMLIRHGAEVIPVMSPEATKIVGPYALEFATGNPAITELTGKVEHVWYCGDVADRADLYLIAPCTANTLGKIVAGIDDTPVTTFATTAIGTGIPMVIVPAMHNTMYDHPVVKENLVKAKGMGIGIVDPMISEKKAKMAPIESIVDAAIRAVSGQPLAFRKVLVVTGATVEPIDDMRVVSNRSTGRTGVLLAVEAYRRGADVALIAGSYVQDVPQHIRTIRYEGVMDLWERIEGAGSFDVALFPAAISDYIPVREQGKIPSGRDDLIVEMRPSFKVIERFRKKNPGTLLVGFKAESVGDDDELMRRSYRRLEEVGMDMVVANDLSDVSADRNRVLTIFPDKTVLELAGTKSEIASFIIDKCQEMISTREGAR
jgi:phosphopantothenoylcysteine decarboxylase/phosphopantothenate--cysteine ligase